MSDSERPDAESMAYTITPGREPATEFDTSEVQRRLRRMPFAGEIMAPHVRAIEQDPLPPINEKGFRECEGWVAVYEAVVQESKYRRGRRRIDQDRDGADIRLGQRHGRTARRCGCLARRHVRLTQVRG